MLQNILFACDFSSSAGRALEYGADLVERTGATLHCMHVKEVSLGPFVRGDPSPASGGRRLQQQFEERCREQLKSCSVPPDDDHLSFEAKQSGAVAPALVQYAETHDIDLIVMGTQGRRGVERAFSGSVAEEVLRTAPCPVLTTRDPQAGDASGYAPVQRLVVPIDFSEASRGALRYAVRLGSVYDVAMTLVHVVQFPTLPAVYGIEFSELARQDVKERVEEELREWGEAEATGDRTLSYELKSGIPGTSILDVASEPSDLLVMATRGVSGFKRTMLGSVAEEVLRRANGPVLSGRTFPAG